MPVLGFVSAGSALKRELLRRSGRVTVVLRAGWEWVAMDRLPTLLRDIFTAAGGTHDNWKGFDRVMATERRIAVLVRLERLTSNA